MKQVQRGFTLIELVMVIVILGVLAAVALPKFVNLKADAQAAALLGVAGSINSASAINFGAKSANSTKGFTTKGVTCSAAAAGIMQGGVMPTGYTSTTSLVTTTVGEGTDCEIGQTDGGATGTATIIAI